MHNRYSKLFSCAIAVAFALIPALAYAQQGKAPSIRTNATDGTPALIAFPDGAGIKADAVQAVFHRYLPMSTADSLGLAKTTHPGDGLTYQRYIQYFNGHKVEHGSYVVASQNGIVSYMSGRFYKAPAATLPTVNEAEALNAALGYIGADQYMWQVNTREQHLKKMQHNADTSYFPKGTLVWIENFKGEGNRNGILHLAWRFNIYASKPLSRSLIYVDAATKKILLSDAQIKHVAGTGVSLYSGTVPMQVAKLGATTYSLIDSTRGNGIFTYDLENGTDVSEAVAITNTTANWLTANAAVDAHWGAEKVYDYWDSLHNRLSYDDNNSALMSYVHYDYDYDNAFWDGEEMNYGDGSGVANGGESPLVSLDVCGHEIGHGVCQETCGLIYEGESGAMNEGFSDIWGASIEHHADPHEVDAQPKETWLIGEELSPTPFRSMSNPKTYGQPDTYLGTNWVPVVGDCENEYDECGVHYNSGILNHWFYLLSVGGTGTNDNNDTYNVSGIGIDSAGKIVYATELSLAAGATYPDCRVTSIAAATLLYGACSPQVEAVTRAWHAVGVGADFVLCVPQIGFTSAQMSVSENAGVATCPASKSISIPVALTGPAMVGGSPTATVSVVGGTAVNGTDYSFTATPLTFTLNDSTGQQVNLTITDNGAIDADRTIKLAIGVTDNGSNAIASETLDTLTITITNDDKLPDTGTVFTRTVGTTNATSNLTSPFYSMARAARAQYIITAAELQAAGIIAGAPLTSVAFFVSAKHSTQPFTDYTVSMAHTPLSILSTDFITGPFTTVYSGNYSTTNNSWNTLPFSNSFTWNGTDNIVMQVCFTNTAAGNASSLGNDRVSGVSGNSIIMDGDTTNGSASGCSLPFSTATLNTAKPLMRFKQTIIGSVVEATASNNHVWDVKSGQQVVFYATADTEVIAAINHPSADLGCTNAVVTQGGNGFVPASFGNVNRSRKEFSITPAQNGSTATYNATLYFRNTELDTTIATSAIRILKTDAATDAEINATNTQVVVPSAISANLQFTGFTGAFTGFSRYFLVDGTPALGISNTTNAASFMHVANNPFSNSITINYKVQQSMDAGIRLYDITGKLIYCSNQQLQPQQSRLVIDLSASALAAGNYMLQVVTPSATLTEKMLKQ